MVLDPNPSRSCLLGFLLAVLAMGAEACNLGVLKVIPGATWKHSSVLSGGSIVPGDNTPRNGRTDWATDPTPLESAILLDIRLPLPPGTNSRVCVRSNAAALQSLCPLAGASKPDQTTSGTISYGPYEPGQWPCLSISTNGTTATATQAFDDPDPSCGSYRYCFSNSSEWTLIHAPGKASSGNPIFTLTVLREFSRFQDTDWWANATTSILSYELVDGCLFGQIAARTSKEKPQDPYCLSCSSGQLAALSISSSTSSSCSYCPQGTSKAGSAWTCVSGLQSGFETIAVRMSPSGLPECASVDGKKCLRSIGGSTTCAAMADKLNKEPTKAAKLAAEAAGIKASGASLKPLTCGEAHKAAWGATGFTSPGHWCVVALEYYQDHQPAGPPGQCKGQSLAPKQQLSGSGNKAQPKAPGGRLLRAIWTLWK